MQGKTIVFVGLAMNQMRFFKALGDKLSEQGFDIAYVSFHERSHEWLASLGAWSFNPYDLQPKDLEEVDIDVFNIEHLNLLLSHEKAAYEVFDSHRLLNKFKGHLFAMDSILVDIRSKVDGEIFLVQELGGFLSVLAAYFVALRNSVPNIFIEPSFFRGRVFLTKNSMQAPVIHGPTAQKATEELSQILENTLEQRAIVIPSKDKQHYRGAFKKLVDFENIKRLFEKLTDRYLLGKKEEFEYAFGHVWRHVRMFITHKRIKNYYCHLPKQPFIYYPFHVPADFALTIRSPQYMDQYALIDYLCRIAPSGYVVVIKEHPALVGAVSFYRMLDLLKRNDNLVILKPEINNYDVLQNSSLVITVNSKSGAEALLLGKQVFVLGDAFYKECDLVTKITDLQCLGENILVALNAANVLDNDLVFRYFQDIWNGSYAGELYEMKASNLNLFARSIVDKLGVNYYS